MRRFPWLTLLALVLGIGLGILYSWVISPVEYVDTLPNMLRADFKDQFRASIAASYAATGNLERARVRLGLLGDGNSVDALSAQAQRMLAAGDTSTSVDQLVQLAAALQSKATVPVAANTASESTATPAATEGTVDSPGPTALTQTVIPEQTIQPPATASSPTPRPTRTPTPRPGAPFELVAQDTLCEQDIQEGLLEVVVMDAKRRELPGIKIVVAWDTEEEQFFTGFKPELGDGYADFVMQAGMLYSVRVAEGSPPVSNVTAPSCKAPDGTAYTGSIRLTFQQD